MPPPNFRNALCVLCYDYICLKIEIHFNFLQLLMRELGDCGYAGAEVRNAPLKTEIIIRATQTKDVLGALCALCK